MIKLFLDIINNPDKIVPYKNLANYYRENNMIQEYEAISYLISQKYANTDNNT